MDELVFDNYSKYYELLYHDKEYKKEAKYVYTTLTAYQPGIKNILELGMGTGIHASLLQEFGLTVTGIELSESMAAQARKKGLTCYTANCTDFSLNQKFDAVISLFHVMSYLTSNRDILRALENAHEHLVEGGIFLFDIWYSPAVYNLKPEVRIKRLNDSDIKVTRLAEPEMNWNANSVDVNYEIFIESEGKMMKINEKHPMRHFSLPELDLLAQMAGFTFIHSEEWLTATQPSQETWGVTCIFKK